MALAKISDLKTALSVGARPNLFKVSIDWPTALGTNENVSAVTGTSYGADSNAEYKQNLLCKTAALPGMSIGIIEVPTRGGRRIKIPGDRTFADWTVTFLSDEAHDLRFAFKTWQEYMKTSDYESDVIRADNNTAFDYTADLFVYQLNSAGGVTRSYKLFECFPTDVGAIDLSFDSTDSLSEFTVTFQYHHMTALQGNQGVEPTFTDESDMDASGQETPD